MPGLQFEDLPAGQDPLEIINQNTEDQLRRVRMETANASYALDQQKRYMRPEEYRQKRAQLDAQIDAKIYDYRFKKDLVNRHVNRVQDLMRDQSISAEAGQRALWEIAIPGSTKQMGKEQPVTPYSPSYITSPGVIESMQQFAGGAQEDPWYKPGIDHKTKQGLLRAYSEWKSQVGYDYVGRNPRERMVKQAQLDQRWDDLMRSDAKYSKWFIDKKKRTPISEVKSMRATGPLSQAMGRRLKQSPISQSMIQKKQQAEKKKAPRKTLAGYYGIPPKDRPPLWKYEHPDSPEALRKAGTKEAFEKGVKLGYWEE